MRTHSTRKIRERYAALQTLDRLRREIGARYPTDAERETEEAQAWIYQRTQELVYGQKEVTPRVHNCTTCFLSGEPDDHPGCVGCHGVGGFPRWRSGCTLPEDVDEWGWRTTDSLLTYATSGNWGISIRPDDGALMWLVYEDQRLIACAPCRTVDEGKRVAIEAALGAWEIKNEGSDSDLRARGEGIQMKKGEVK